MTVQYDGTHYHGWQEQPGLATVQGTLADTLAMILGHRVAVDGAGRTDAGVHARGQVAAFTTARAIEPARLQAALNSRLPDDIAVADLVEALPDFDPTRDAVAKHYRYRLWRSRAKPVFEARYVWHWYRSLDLGPMREAAGRLVGTHDFKSFESRGNPRETTVRTLLRVDVTEAEPPEVCIDIEGDGFLYRMVRNVVGTLVEVGRGHRPPEWIDAVLAARDRTAAGPCAPPQGLCLMAVRYPPPPAE